MAEERVVLRYHLESFEMIWPSTANISKSNEVVLSCHIASHQMRLRQVISRDIVSYHVTSRHIIENLITFHHDTSHYITWYRCMQCQIVSHYITSHHSPTIALWYSGLSGSSFRDSDSITGSWGGMHWAALKPERTKRGSMDVSLRRKPGCCGYTWTGVMYLLRYVV